MSWWSELFVPPTESWAKVWVDAEADAKALHQLETSRWITTRVYAETPGTTGVTSTAFSYHTGAPSLQAKVEQDRMILLYVEAEVNTNAGVNSTDVGIEIPGQAIAPGQASIVWVIENWKTPGGVRQMVSNGARGDDWPHGEFIPIFGLTPKPDQTFRLVYRRGPVTGAEFGYVTGAKLAFVSL